MKVFVLGATGFIGRHLVNALLAQGHEITAVTRDARRGRETLGAAVALVEADPKAPGDWQKEVGKAQAVVHLGGEPILKERWTEARKQILLDSRLIPTKLLVEAMAEAENRPGVFLCGSAIGYYGNRGDQLLTEESAPGADFGAKMCLGWETEANKAGALGVRVVNLRTGFVLGPGGGLAQMVAPFKFFAGGPMGSGRQYLSWIHIDDHVGLTIFALGNERLRGGLNMTAPAPVTNRDFAKILGQVLARPSWLPVPAFAIKRMFGEGAALLLEGQRVLPKKAQEAGYKWKFSDLAAALTEVLKKPGKSGT